MNQLDERQMQVHVPIVAWLLIASNILFLLIAAFVFVLLVGVGIASGDAEATRVLTIVGFFVAALLFVLGVPGLIAGVGLLARRSWARVLAIIVAVLGLVNVPLGTIIGLYAGWVLLQESAQAYFSPHGRI